MPEEAEAVRHAFELYASGSRSIADIGELLNGRGLRPRSKRRKTRCSKDNVGGMLANLFYVGDIVYKGEIVAQGRHEPIIDRALWQQVYDAKLRRAARRATHPTARRTYLLSGVARCTRFSALLWGNRSRGLHYYEARRDSADIAARTGRVAQARRVSRGRLGASSPTSISRTTGRASSSRWSRRAGTPILSNKSASAYRQGASAPCGCCSTGKSTKAWRARSRAASMPASPSSHLPTRA